MTQLTREERFRLAAEAEGGMPVSAGPRVGHIRTAEGGGRFLYLDLLSVRESARPALIAQIKELVAATTSADEERDPSGAATAGRAGVIRKLVNLAVKWLLRGKVSPDSPAGDNDPASGYIYAPSAAEASKLHALFADEIQNAMLKQMAAKGGPKLPAGGDDILRDLVSAPSAAWGSNIREAALKMLEGKGGYASPELIVFPRDPARADLRTGRAPKGRRLYEAALKMLEGKGGYASPDAPAGGNLTLLYITDRCLATFSEISEAAPKRTAKVDRDRPDTAAESPPA